MSVRKKAIGRNVRFSEEESILFIPHRESYSEQDIDSLWFSRRKLDVIRRKSRFLKDLMSGMDCVLVSEERYCTLGLETKAEAREKRIRIHEARMAVFMEQELQRETKSADDDMVSNLYSAASRFTVFEARKRALLIATEVHKVPLFKNFDGVDCCNALTRSVKEDILANALKIKSGPQKIFACEQSISRWQCLSGVPPPNKRNAVCPARRAIDSAVPAAKR